MSVVKLRIEIERALRTYAAGRGDALTRTSIGAGLRDLKRRGVAPPSTDRFIEALRTMNEAAHGFDIDAAAAEQAVSVGSEFLAELSALKAGQ